MEINSILLAFLLTMIAGLSTGVGSLIAFFAKRTNTKFLSAALGFSAGVMIYISFMELMPEALGMLSENFSPRMSNIYMLIAFFSGTSFIALIDFLIPEDENPHEIHRVDELSGQQRLHRTGILMALAISIHNFPEGLATGQYRHSYSHRHSHCHSQHTGRYRCLRTHLSSDGQPQESILVFPAFRYGRAGRRTHRIPVSVTFLDSHDSRASIGIRIGYYGVHFIRWAAAGSRKIRSSSLRHRRCHHRHGSHGSQPPVFHLTPG